MLKAQQATLVVDHDLRFIDGAEKRCTSRDRPSAIDLYISGDTQIHVVVCLIPSRIATVVA